MCASMHTSSIAERESLLSSVSRRVSCDLCLSGPAHGQGGEVVTERGLRTLIVPGDGGLMSSVANAGELVSPALISPPSPLDRLRTRGLSMLVGPPRGVNLSVVERSGKASVAGIVNVQVLRLPGTKSVGD
jgi:hypothetical protein